MAGREGWGIHCVASGDAASINQTLPSPQHSAYLTPTIDCSDFISWAYGKSEFEETVGVSPELVLQTLQNLEQGQVRS